MGAVASRSNIFVRSMTWRGRSGRSYRLIPEDLRDFAFEADLLYVVAKGGNVLWAGAADDLISDQQSRARFRLAVNVADRAFRLEAEGDAVARMTTVWDLEGAEPVSELSAA